MPYQKCLVPYSVHGGIGRVEGLTDKFPGLLPVLPGLLGMSVQQHHCLPNLAHLQQTAVRHRILEQQRPDRVVSLCTVDIASVPL